MAETIQASFGIIFNSFEELELTKLAKCRRHFPILIFTVDPFHKLFVASSSSLLPQDRSCISWLDKQEKLKPVLYMSFRSLLIVSEAQFLKIAWGLVNSGQPFLWVVLLGTICGLEWLEALLGGFLDGRGHIVKWALQHEVLVHPVVGGIWTHTKWNLTLKRVNSRYISNEWRVGLHLEYKVERRDIKDAIRRLMVSYDGEEMREKMKAFEEEGGRVSPRLVVLHTSLFRN
ncbi:UDP-glycosyltransferase 76B1-like [Eucalyptus grandis]|uniref:UDP-glycosyltransferase 76B1-like n=1 Tax=Eucalyptus grandis TaxID=71139 RepID=UPI00192EB5F7|nr:UDP-glycosyltransferase 76B1-like [Eucalyptus grandis]